MTQFKTVSLADRVYEKLEDDIIRGVYPRGEYLTELRLAEELGMSRTPIREALRRLEQEGLTEETGKGSRVLGITEEDLRDIMDIRLEVEGMAAWYVARNITDDQLKQLHEIMDLQEFYYEKNDRAQISEMDSRFHEMISLFSGHKLLHDTLMPLLKKSSQYRRNSVFKVADSNCVVSEHKKIYQAIEARDPEQAKAATRNHVIHAGNRILDGRYRPQSEEEN